MVLPSLHELLLTYSLTAALMRYARAFVKSGVWFTIDRVPLIDAVFICGGLDNDEAMRITGTGTVIREAKLDLLTVNNFHHWIPNGYGLSKIDQRGDCFSVLGCIIQHITPANVLKTPYIKLKCEVLFPL